MLIVVKIVAAVSTAVIVVVILSISLPIYRMYVSAFFHIKISWKQLLSLPLMLAAVIPLVMYSYHLSVFAQAVPPSALQIFLSHCSILSSASSNCVCLPLAPVLLR